MLTLLTVVRRIVGHIGFEAEFKISGRSLCPFIARLRSCLNVMVREEASGFRLPGTGFKSCAIEFIFGENRLGVGPVEIELSSLVFLLYAQVNV